MKLYNTLTRQKEEFVVKNGEVRMYVCGPTVYNYFHIGNARCFVVFDMLRRYLEYRGNKVTFVQNFTDVDDKLIRAAKENSCTVPEIAERYIKEYFTDARGLGVNDATVHPRATENIDKIIEIVQNLINNGHAYVSGNDVYFDSQSDSHYGKLSHYNMDVRELMLMILRSIPLTLHFGRARKRKAKFLGSHLGVKVVPVGTSNAPLWLISIWVPKSTFTAAGLT